MQDALVNEIFASIQGEGPWVGERHIFIRFQGCDLRCRYCDTPESVTAHSRQGAGNASSVQTGWESASSFETVKNPVTAAELTERCMRLSVPGPSRHTISLTGGEPLLQHRFLVEWLPSVRHRYRIYLETNGVRADAMHIVRDLVDVVSMDFKLPSATALGPLWDEHERFIRAAAGTVLVAKAVITADTSREDLLAAARIIAAHDISLPLILQPAGGALRPPTDMLVDFQHLALGMLADVRVIPQIHKILNVR